MDKLKFQKLRDTRVGINYDWLLVIENEDELWLYHDYHFKSMVESAWDNLTQYQKGVAHINTHLGSLIHFRTEFNGGSYVQKTAEIIDDIHYSRLNLIKKWGKIYINKNGGYFFPHKDLIVVDEFIITDKKSIRKFKYPEYSEKDIKLKQWKGGSHWYAKIGNYDVVDSDGNQKWDTYQESKKCANEFLKTI